MWTERERVITNFDEAIEYIESKECFHDYRLGNIDIGENCISKIARNRERDEEVNKKLVFMGWTVIRFWGKDIRKNVDKCVNVIEETIFEIKLERDEEIDFNDNLDL